MSVRNYKPITPGQRKRSTLVNEEITKSTPEKSLVVSLKKMVVVTIKVELPLDIKVAELRENIVLLILNVINVIFQVPLLVSNTIQTERQILP